MREADTPEERARRTTDAIAMQAIEGNPFTPEDEALFAALDAEGLSDEEQIAQIKALCAPSVVTAAE